MKKINLANWLSEGLEEDKAARPVSYTHLRAHET